MRPWSFGTITVRHGTPAVRELSFLFDDGSPRTDLDTCDAFFTVYTTSAGTTPLFPEVKLSAPYATAQRTLTLTQAQCTQSKSSYYAEIEFRDDQGNVVADGGWFGEFAIAGK